MKNILKYTAFAALTLTMAGCEEFVDHTQTVGGTPKLVYVEANADNFFQARIVHRPAGSTGTFETEFAVNCNSPVHAALEVALAYDASLVEGYNAEHGTDYAVLPEEYLVLENTILSLPENAVVTEEKMKVSLSAEADLSQLTARRYLAPLAIRSQGFDVSEELGTVWVAVETETNIIRTIGSVDEMIGFPAAGRSHWLADCSGFKNLFDGITSTSCSFDKQRGNVVVIDMGEPHIVTGFSVYSASGSISYEYSLDGESWQQAGTPVAGEYVASGQQKYIALESNVEAQYLRLTADFTSSYSRTIGEFNIYLIEGADPAVYTICGTDNVVTGSITHHVSAGSWATLDAAFNALRTTRPDSDWKVGASVDNSLVAAYNAANHTSYAEIPAANVLVEGSPCTIEAGTSKSAGQIRVSLKGDLSTITNDAGYLIPVRLSAPAGAVVSENRGTVYVVLAVEYSTELFRTHFTENDITGTPVADRTGWTIVECDESGIYSGKYTDLFDGNAATYLRTWGGPISFTVDLGKDYDLTGLVITSRSDYGTKYCPRSIEIEYSLDGNEYTLLGTPSQSDGTVLKALPHGYVALYGSQKVRYLKINADYGGSNMGTGEFNIYAK